MTTHQHNRFKRSEAPNVFPSELLHTLVEYKVETASYALPLAAYQLAKKSFKEYELPTFLGDWAVGRLFQNVFLTKTFTQCLRYHKEANLGKALFEAYKYEETCVCNIKDKNKPHPHTTKENEAMRDVFEYIASNLCMLTEEAPFLLYNEYKYKYPSIQNNPFTEDFRYRFKTIFADAIERMRIHCQIAKEDDKTSGTIRELAESFIVAIKDYIRKSWNHIYFVTGIIREVNDYTINHIAYFVLSKYMLLSINNPIHSIINDTVDGLIYRYRILDTIEDNFEIKQVREEVYTMVYDMLYLLKTYATWDSENISIPKMRIERLFRATPY